MFKSAFSKLVNALGTVLAIVIAAVAIFAGVAQILSFYFDHKNVVVESFQNIAGYFGSANVSNTKCRQYERQFEKVDCDQKTNPSERLLCKVTVPPVKMVCIDDRNSKTAIPNE